jgi:hypothetical protein
MRRLKKYSDFKQHSYIKSTWENKKEKKINCCETQGEIFWVNEIMMIASAE